jgi:hypothetical protein
MMKSLYRTLKTSAVGLAGSLWMAAPLFAAKDGPSDSSGGNGGPGVIAYILTGLPIILGLLVVCRTSSRRDRIKPEGYSESKVGVDKLK